MFGSGFVRRAMMTLFNLLIAFVGRNVLFATLTIVMMGAVRGIGRHQTSS